MEVVGILHEGGTVFDKISRNVADVLLLDLNLPDRDGLDLLPELTKKYPELKVIVVTMYDHPKFIQESFKSGASGYILKSSGFSELKKAIIEVTGGNRYIGDGLMMFPKEIVEQKNGKFDDTYSIKNKLTKREKEILILISQAKSSKEIAEVLFISDQTVSVHRKNIMRKLNVNNTASLIKFAIQNNLID
jgi:DNA-binding NarL/FixJ family response regulator